MSQKIDIGVNANTGQAEASVKGIERAADGVAEALANVNKQARAAADGIKDVETQSQRLKNTQSILQRELGRDISSRDADHFLKSFDRLRSGRGIGSRNVRGFNDFESWYQGHSGIFKNPGDAAAHRRRVLAMGMQGTSYAANYGAPTGSHNDDDGRSQPVGMDFGRGVQRAQSTAMAFGKSMLALAGLHSIVGMAGSAADMATEENVGLDTLKRAAGDLTTDFQKLRDEVRGSTDGLGVTYVEAARLSQQFAKTAGNLERVNIAGNVRTGIGFSRSYGLDPTEGVQFFGTMKRLGATGGDEQSARKLALMIGDAVNEGGYLGKADEILGAVADYATQITRITLATPNVGDYAAMLTSLIKTGLPGLDPQGAAALLNAADASVRRGGGMGEAGLNFSYAAIRRSSPGIDPVSAQAMMSGGLFGTTENTFGAGTALGDWYGARGIATPRSSNVTNFEKMRGLMRRQYGSSPYYLDAMKNFFGLSSVQQAAALDNMNPSDLTASQRLLGNAGVDISRLSASGIQGVSSIAGARGMGDLTSIYARTMGRSDISGADRGNLSAAFKTGDVEKLRHALVRVVGTYDQEKTEGSETRQSISDLKNELTRIGGSLLFPLNAIRDGVTMMSMALAPEEYKRRMQDQKDASTDYAAIYRARGGRAPGFLDSAMAGDKARYEKMKAAGDGPVNLDDVIAKPEQARATLDPANYAYEMARRQAVQKMIEKDFGVSSATVPQSWLDEMSETDRLLGLPAGMSARQIGKESSFDPNAVNVKSGAIGLAQVMPSTLAALNKRFGRVLDPTDPMDALLIHREVMRENKARFGSDADALRAYNAGWDKSKWNNTETNDYVDTIMGATPMPGAAPGGGNGGGEYTVSFAGEVNLPVKDSRGAEIGSATIRPFVSGRPAGSLNQSQWVR
ncbi:lytic transglycosylase domain-containing protein [Parvibaculum sp.]|uniref:lytic transglycosylase domain-containing protein n=1 Tax=Parvibaculum sp. TaxID=2024848 RepID=UPI00273491A9|nr:lytic transglycosylase domain-containing protein [Parvibaculum sp.]MDP3327207.1 lytic transglycosylase domain-containing protein [Parvibaculum sp.]